MNKIFRNILLSYIISAFSGALLLSIPMMKKEHIPFIDMVFTSISAVCVTGLTTIDLSTQLTTYGQAVILALIQFGGLGFMLIASMLFMVIGHKFDLNNLKGLSVSLNHPGLGDMKKFIKKVIISVFVIEGVGAILLSMKFALDMPLKSAIWAGVFHSVSAFNNAGFSIFGGNLMGYASSQSIQLIISTLIIFGGLGFLVIWECYAFYKTKIMRISIHTKIVLVATICCLVVAMGAMLLFESQPNGALWGLSWGDKILNAYFYSVNLRTSGFNTLDLSHLQDQSLFFSCIFMIIGAAPGGTAGGIKVTVVAVLGIYAYRTLRNQKCFVFRRQIPNETIKKAFLILFIAVFYIVISAMILSATEDKHNHYFLPLLYEICSAFGTVGLSVGDGGALSLSANFGEFGKIYMMTLMLLGRVGVLVFSSALFGQKVSEKVQYPTEEVIL